MQPLPARAVYTVKSIACYLGVRIKSFFMTQQNKTQNTGNAPKENKQREDASQQQPSPAENEDGTPVLDEEDLDENNLDEEQAEEIEWDEPEEEDEEISPEEDDDDNE